MNVVYLGLGSNVEREENLQSGVQALNALIQNEGKLQFSPVYESAAVGFRGEPFLNLVACLQTPLSLEVLALKLREIEIENGRRENEKRFAPKTLDIDILLFNDLVGCYAQVQLPREEILHNAFVLKPLADIAADKKHPIVQQTYLELWEAFEQSCSNNKTECESQSLILLKDLDFNVFELKA